MKNTLSNILAACALLACLAFSGTNEMVITTPSKPKEIEVKQFNAFDDARGYILAQHYKGWIVKQFDAQPYNNKWYVILEKY